jgi:ADP-ribose pyrophosphatase YjhB (NUDIX family)
MVEIIARGVCVRRGRILLCHKKGAANTFLPGGHVEFGESATRSLTREIEEELGLSARTRRFLGAVEHSFMQDGEPHCEVNLVFDLAVGGLGRDAPASREDYIEFFWVPVADLRKSGLEPWPLQTRLRAWLDRRSTAQRWASTHRKLV